MRQRICVLCIAVLLCSTWCLAQQGPEKGSAGSAKKIIFIAGPKDHGGPGAHEYEKDLRLLKRCLDHATNVQGITTEIYVGRVPKDIAVLADAAAIVIHSSGDGRQDETHALFHMHDRQNPAATYSEADARYMRQLDSLAKKGLGVVVLHYSLIVENERSREYLLDWIGGYHRAGKSQVKIDRGEAVPAAPGHPILGGVRPWTTDHEYYFNQHFRPNDDRFRPILTSMLPSSDPKKQKHAIAWAVERPGGGRGFAFTGGHYHKNMQVESYRRMLLGAILWTAKVPVPKQGVESAVAE